MKSRGKLGELNGAELEEKRRHLREEQFNLRFQAAAGRLKNFGRIRQVRRMIARVETQLSRRAQGA